MSVKLIDEKKVNKYLKSLDLVSSDHRFGKENNCFVYNDEVFAVVKKNSKPVKLSLLCDPLLSKTLREKYETVMPGEKLNPKKWNTILLTGQMEWPEIKDLITHSYIRISSAQ